MIPQPARGTGSLDVNHLARFRDLVDRYEPVCGISESVWNLDARVLARIGSKSTLIEWDSKLPDWPALRAQALTAQRFMSGIAAAFKQGVGHEA